jgi:hypothetical protein
MLTKIVVTGTLLAALGSFKPVGIADSVGWQALRNSAVLAASLQR